jgi:para-nitrobenzyl esterase
MTAEIGWMRRAWLYRAGLCVFAGCALSQPLQSADILPTEPVCIDAGAVSGSALGDKKDVHVYKGIPFAAPPVGNLRWKPPQPVKRWDGVRVCTDFGPACPQPKVAIFGAARTNEDCLYLNVWAPAKHAGERLPVMVWIHGGAYVIGSGSIDGEALARQGVVVVTINYRLGAFGFLAHPLLSKESEKGVSGNYGLLDQIAALQWVKLNIAAFGGDPNCVTIFGESAGAGSVCHLLVSPLAKGLFQRALAQSGSARGPSRHIRERWNGLRSMHALGEEIAKTLGCEGNEALAALRAKKPDELLRAAKPSDELFGFVFGPIVDGWVIPDEPLVLFDQGKACDVPFLTGTNADEAAMFTVTVPAKSVADYQLGLKKLFPDDAERERAFRLFPAKKDKDVRAALNRAVTLSVFVASARADARAMSRGNSKAYLYRFTRVHPWARLLNLGALHGSEIPYVFGNIPEKLGYQPKDRELSNTMTACWVRFAKTGDPNGDGVPKWPAYGLQTDKYLEFGDGVQTGEEFEKAACDFLDEIRADRLKKRKEP